MTRIRRTRPLLFALAGLALALPASHAASQDRSQRPTISTITTMRSDDGEFSMEISQTVDGVKYELSMRNDEIVSVTADGLALAQDAYERTPEAVIIRDGDREITFDLRVFGLRDRRAIRLFAEPGRGMGVEAFPRGEMLLPGGFLDADGVRWAPANPPKTMVGLSQTSVGDQLRGHLGLEEGVGLIVISVVEDLPASKAGVRAGDVIIEIAGEPARSSAQLTDALRQREPGDTLGMVVLRKGVPQSLELELVAYDAAKLNRDVRVLGLNRPDAPDAPAVEIERLRGLIERQAADAAREGQRLNELLIRRGDRAIVIEGEDNRLRQRTDEVRRLRDEANERLWGLIERLDEADTDAARRELTEQLEAARRQAMELHRQFEPLRRRAERLGEEAAAELRPQAERYAEWAERLAREAEEGLAERNRELEARLEAMEARLDRLLRALEADE